MMPARPKELKAAGVLGINRRNAHYTLWYNRRRFYPLVDDKLQTKELAIRAGINVPELYAVVEYEAQVRRLPEVLASRGDFVIKPAHGSGGEGIMVIAGTSKGRFRTVSGALLSQADLDHHIYNVLSGLYSLGGQRDKVIIEYRVEIDPIFESISHQGVPDIRVIVFLGVPVMSMVRLPTRQSSGKANLHQGAIGAGVDLASGRTLGAVWKSQVVWEHPDTGNPVSGVQIPGWDFLIRLAAGCCDLTGLNYIGVDLVLDRTKGPMILELNARPGLAIQIANQTGLLGRLRQVEENRGDLTTLDQRVQFAKTRFADNRPPQGLCTVAAGRGEPTSPA